MIMYSIYRAVAMVFWRVMVGDLCSTDLEFESQDPILDGYFSHLFIMKIVLFVCLKRT